jgi:hypothetical protein
MKHTIKRITIADNYLWDEFVNSSPQGDIFQLSFYLQAWVEHDPEIHLTRLGCFDQDNKLVGGQAFLHKKKAGVLPVQCLLQTWTHIETPMVAAHISQGGEAYFDILQLLAEDTVKIFAFYRLFFHPSLKDVRPYLECGWTASPDYAHGWQLQQPEVLLDKLKQLRRFRKALEIKDQYELSTEQDPSIVDSFIPMYEDTAEHLRISLRPSYGQIFREAAREMMKRNLIRFFTCRNKHGEIAGIVTYTINHHQKTAYNFQVAYNYLLEGEKDFLPLLELYAIEQLAPDVTHIDLGEGLWPSLYFNKDALLTTSTQYYALITPNSHFWNNVIEMARSVKKKVVSVAKSK